MADVSTALTAKLPHLPASAGVYLWKDAEGTVLYVGKAKHLRSRVRSYLGDDQQASVKTYALMRHAVDVDTIVVPSEAHALILEANLIKEYRPRFNIQLRDDKSYPYIKVTVQEPFPRVYVTRRLQNDGARYFGPYTEVGTMRRSLNVVKRLFTVRSCNYDMPTDMPERPCLDFFIKRCKAPCALHQSQAEYKAMIDEVIFFLDGRTDQVVKRVRERMELAAESLDFERAAELRDALKHLEQMEEPAVVMQVEGGDRDVIGYARDGDDACVAVMKIRRGKLLARNHHFLDNIEGEPDTAILSAYLARTYVAFEEKAPELLVPFDFEDRELLEQSLEKTKVHVPQRGSRRELIDHAQQNARHLLEEFKLSSEETEQRAANPVYELQRELKLQTVPRSFVVFDISTSQGTDTVGSAIWFENGRPRRAEYRKFKVKTVEGTDDFASMKEVIGRYFRRRIDEREPMPDLIVVDGGKGQLGVARETLTDLALDSIPLISLAKREEEIFVAGRLEPLRLPRRSLALRLLQQARDEAHRFAITYNRKRRTMRTVTSELLSIPGIGPKKRRQLLQRFGSIQGIRDASDADIAALPGFTAASAAKLRTALAAVSPTSTGVVDPAAAPPSESAEPVASDVDIVSPTPGAQ